MWVPQASLLAWEERLPHPKNASMRRIACNNLRRPSKFRPSNFLLRSLVLVSCASLSCSPGPCSPGRWLSEASPERPSPESNLDGEAAACEEIKPSDHHDPCSPFT